MTQPAISQHIKSLESQLGHRLFERSNKGIVALPAGHDLAAATAQHIDALQNAFEQRKGISKQVSGMVHLGAPSEFFSYYFDCCKPLLDAGIQLNVRLAGKEALYSMLDKGDIDIAVTASIPQEKNFERTLLGQERLILVCARSVFEQCKGRQINLQLLNTFGFISYDAELPLIKRYFKHDPHINTIGTPLISCPDLRTVINLCMRYHAWSVMPEYLVKDALEAGQLFTLKSPEPEHLNDFYLVWKKPSLRNARTAFAQQQLMISCRHALT